MGPFGNERGPTAKSSASPRRLWVLPRNGVGPQMSRTVPYQPTSHYSLVMLCFIMSSIPSPASLFLVLFLIQLLIYTYLYNLYLYHCWLFWAFANQVCLLFSDVNFIASPPSMIAAGSVAAAVQGLYLKSPDSCLSSQNLTNFLSQVIRSDPVSVPVPSVYYFRGFTSFYSPVSHMYLL